MRDNSCGDIFTFSNNITHPCQVLNHPKSARTTSVGVVERNKVSNFRIVWFTIHNDYIRHAALTGVCHFKDNLILRWGEEGVAISLNNIKIKDNRPFSILRLRVVNYKPSGFINFGILFCVLRNRSVFKCLTNNVRESWFPYNLSCNINPHTIRIQLIRIFRCVASDSIVLI